VKIELKVLTGVFAIVFLWGLVSGVSNVVHARQNFAGLLAAGVAATVQFGMALQALIGIAVCVGAQGIIAAFEGWRRELEK
jgi:hypothetical protein